jgi:WD40 repeat protein
MSNEITGWHLGGGSWREGHRTFLRADGGFLREYDGRRARLLRAPHPLGNKISDVDHSPDGSVVAAAERSGRVTLLDADTLEPIGTSVELDASVAGVSAGPDNRTAFVMTAQQKIFGYWEAEAHGWALVDLEEGVVLREGEFPFIGNWPAYSPDGEHAVITSFSGEVLVLDLRTGEPVRPAVKGHASGVFWAAFSPDGARLVTAAEDGSVVLWETATGSPVARVSIPVFPSAASAEFRADGTVLIVPWGIDPAVYVWDPEGARAAAFACRAAGRELTEDEWRDAFGTLPYREVCAGR